MWLALATFTPAATLIILVPGPDTLIVLRSIVRRGRAHGWVTAAGTLTGLAVWAVVAAVGLAAVLRASETAYAALRIAGACYLCYLGVQSLRSLMRKRPRDETERAGILGTGYPAGVITNLLNPKVGVFFVTFLPGFVPHGYPVGPTSLLFGALFGATDSWALFTGTKATSKGARRAVGPLMSVTWAPRSRAASASA